MSPFGYLPRYLEILGNLVTYSPNQILKQKFATRGHFLMVLAFPRERRSLCDAYPEERLPPGVLEEEFGRMILEKKVLPGGLYKSSVNAVNSCSWR